MDEIYTIIIGRYILDAAELKFDGALPLSSLPSALNGLVTQVILESMVVRETVPTAQNSYGW